MARRALRSADFVAAVRADLEYLERIDRMEWVDILEDDLREVERLICLFPRSGKLVASRPNRELRRARLRNAPFFVWYEFEPARISGPVTLLRLFHERQKTPPRPRW